VSDPKLSERMYGRARDRDLERAAERFADTVHADVSAQVRLAWALERDRLYAEIAELRDELHTLTRAYKQHVQYHLSADPDPALHSVRVEP